MAGEEEDRLLGFLDTLQQAVATETLRLPQHTQEAAEEKDRTQPKRLLPCLAAAGRGQAEIELRSKLGEGGMGVVYLAEQVALGRPVAVKSISPVRQDARTVGILLHEAWITGQLEHPNVVPVYTLGQDEAGSPLLVMKRIEGVSWREVLSGKALLPAGQGDGAETEPLVRHLQVLMQVCRAVHFAHSRGIIHCDLKPDNVMIGEFGEVYVLDWGVAVSLHQERDDSYPLARDVDSPVGTPAYMSPEQAMGQGCRFSPATDVYLLGAILHEILTGERRHTGNNLMAVLLDAHRSAPVSYPAKVPGELAAISNRATHADPALRFASAEAFRLALVSFLRHRNAQALAEEAEARLTELRELLDSLHRAEAVELPQIHSLFGQCRFGFQLALRSWPENERAREGLQLLLQSMAAHELWQGSAEAAAVLIRELPRPDPELQARLAELQAKRVREKEELSELRELRHQVDIRVESRFRSFFAFFIVGFVFFIPLPGALLERLDLLLISDEAFSFLSLLDPLVIGLAIYIGRQQLLRTRANQLIILGILLSLLGRVIHRLAVILLDIPSAQVIPAETMGNLIILSLIAHTVDVRLYWFTPIYLVATAVAYASPTNAHLALPLANLAIFVVVGLRWRSMALASETGT